MASSVNPDEKLYTKTSNIQLLSHIHQRIFFSKTMASARKETQRTNVKEVS
jgi:hypothetical protein